MSNLISAIVGAVIGALATIYVAPKPTSSTFVETKTSINDAAGTDSQLYFDIYDSAGRLITSIHTDGGAGKNDRILEKGERDIFGGDDDGTHAPSSMAVRIVLEGEGKHWLPERIAVHSSLLAVPYCYPLDQLRWLDAKNPAFAARELEPC